VTNQNNRLVQELQNEMKPITDESPIADESVAPVPHVSASTSGTGNGSSTPSYQVANAFLPPGFSLLQLQADAADDADASALADCLANLNFLYASREFQLIEEELIASTGKGARRGNSSS